MHSSCCFKDRFWGLLHLLTVSFTPGVVQPYSYHQGVTHLGSLLNFLRDHWVLSTLAIQVENFSPLCVRSWNFFNLSSSFLPSIAEHPSMQAWLSTQADSGAHPGRFLKLFLCSSILSGRSDPQSSAASASPILTSISSFQRELDPAWGSPTCTRAWEIASWQKYGAIVGLTLLVYLLSGS